MLVVLTRENILSVQQVCQGCLLADRQGLPRWHHGKLGCGHSLGTMGHNQSALYECEMGFQVAQLEG
jgi:hypothetical protein